MKLLLSITAFIEGATGLSLLIIPSVVVSLLLGVSLIEPVGLVLGRIGGIALFSLALACWLAKEDSKASIAMIAALTLYNFSSAMLLGYVAVVENLSGIGLWPAVLLHIGLLLWCFKCLRKR
ncbi:MAG: hypothetical protein WKF87_16085 [Chryseolinea sp.]